MHRIAITPKDDMILRGVTYATAKRHFSRLRIHFGKPPRAIITFAEYCQYHRLTEAEVRAALRRT